MGIQKFIIWVATSSHSKKLGGPIRCYHLFGDPIDLEMYNPKERTDWISIRRFYEKVYNALSFFLLIQLKWPKSNVFLKSILQNKDKKSIQELQL